MTVPQQRSTVAALALLSLAGLVGACTTAAPMRAQRPWQSLDVQVGMRNYTDLDPVEDQTTFGLEYVHERPGDAFGWGIGVTYAQQDGTGPDGGGGSVDVEADVYEIYAGLRRSFDTSSALRPYVGLGLNLVAVQAEVSDAGGDSSDDDTSTGFYVRAGLLYDISSTLHLGFDARTVFGTEDLAIGDSSPDADHNQLALVLGFSF